MLQRALRHHPELKLGENGFKISMRVLHPLFVHLHVAFLLMAFVAMYT